MIRRILATHQIVSPGLMLRPSLSAASGPSGRRPSPGVAGADAPAFVERCQCRSHPPRPRGVAGADAPAFVERSSMPSEQCAYWKVSPGLMLRPSLSVLHAVRTVRILESVAGADAPAFVERRRTTPARRARARVSPGLMLRPSLSGAEGVPVLFPDQQRVAGADAPAFVERDQHSRT